MSFFSGTKRVAIDKSPIWRKEYSRTSFMTAGFKDYLREAFNAKPLGMFVAPNWVLLAATGMLGFLNPGFWLIGAGLELGYLYVLLQNKRFRRYVDAMRSGDEMRSWQETLQDRIAKLSSEDAARFRALEKRCRAVLVRQKENGVSPELGTQAEGLGRLLWIFHGLLQTRQTLRQITDGVNGSTHEKMERLQAQIATAEDENVRKSLAAQLEILRQRDATQKEGKAKVDFLDAELTRIEEQVELIREQSLLAADPAALSRRIDEIGATLGETTHWMREQQKIFGDVQDLMEDVPAIPFRQAQ